MATATKTKAKSKAMKKAHAKPASTKKPAAKKSQGAAWRPPFGPGSFCWHDLWTTDMAGATAFYGALFGWNASVMPLGDGGATQGMITRGTEGIGCLSATTPASPTPRWVPYVLVTDVAAAVSKASSLGAQVTAPATDIPGGHGTFALLKDPQGAEFALYAMPKA